MMKTHPSSTNQKQSGFTLIEIVLALLVITVGIVAVTGLLGSSLDTTVKSHDDLHAVSFSDLVFNYYHSLTNWNDIPPSGAAELDLPDYAGHPFTLQLDTVHQFVNRLPGFNGNEQERYTVSYLFGAEQQDDSLKRLTLQVWPGYGTNETARTFCSEYYNWMKN
jgi:prepilin-type N-terminal cleavage/methylation domain-containing protein